MRLILSSIYKNLQNIDFLRKKESMVYEVMTILLMNADSTLIMEVGFNIINF